MNKEQFKELATETGARKCIHFNWSMSKNKACIRDNMCPCLKLNGKNCEHYKKGVTYDK